VVIEAVRRRLSGAPDVSELVAQLPEALESREFRIRIADPEFARIGAKVRHSATLRDGWIKCSQGLGQSHGQALQGPGVAAHETIASVFQSGELS
jgi:hypothetical protein